ncbi:hypothetical protein [Oceanisphaera psychrotolerans]|uniref:Uncharacterized protein n=1 Tax=Oceanisphaera psychrotolerans TaxID=1414654 RepID=A0A1J4QH47_9GAMM|nr:hypothetical protein [Oceanisphaera psychrotolerans]OIN12188.1 hypothetical protein BFR47_00325 [Oceanisphaera psychrotolerans]
MFVADVQPGLAGDCLQSWQGLFSLHQKKLGSWFSVELSPMYSGRHIVFSDGAEGMDHRYCDAVVIAMDGNPNFAMTAKGAEKT